MADISPRRKFAGRALLAGAALALPLTASISYAEPRVPEAPAAPVAPQTPTAPPAAHAPAAPAVPPAPPAPPAPPVEADMNIDLTIEREMETQVERELDEAVAGLDAAEREVLRAQQHTMTAQERAELRSDMAELRRELGQGGELRREIRMAVSHGLAAAPEVVMSCQRGQTAIVSSGTTGAGREALFVCQAAALESARAALDTARRTIRSDRNLSETERAEALRSLDEALAEMRAKG